MAGGARTLRPISSGELRHVCDIEQLINGVDAAGTPTTKYDLFAKDVRFSFADYRSAEGMQAKELVGQITTYITIRYRPGITTTMRLKHVVDGSVSPYLVDYYDIQGEPIRDPTGRITLLLQCVKRDAAGYRIGTVP